jgi:acyl-CoA thioester hydrolase
MNFPPALAPAFRDYPVVVHQPVQWGELDIAYHVNNTVHARWSETGRVAYFLEYQPEAFTSHELTEGPILAKLQLKYIAPIFFPDTIWIGTRIIDLLEDRYTMESLLVSEKNQRPCALIKAVLVNYDYRTQRKIDLPENFVEEVQAFEARLLAERKNSHPPEGR